MDMIDQGQITAGHGKALLRVNDENLQLELANKVIRKCIKKRDFNVNLMFEYAKKIKVYDKVKNYMEAIDKKFKKFNG